jgi:hypothetical protein
MHNLLLAKMTDEIDKNPALDFLKSVLHNINPYVISGKVTWAVNDAMVMQAVYEEMATGKTMEAAIKDVGSHIPSYRLPANKFIQFLSNPNITMFAAYHYGALKSYVEMAKTLVTGNTAGEVKYSQKADGTYEKSHFGKNSWKARGDTLSKLVMLGIITLVIYPAIDEALKKATGNPNAHIRRAGASTFPYNAYQVYQGNMGFSQFLQSIITPAAATKELGDQLFNIDDFTGNPISPAGSTGMQELQDRLGHVGMSLSPYAQFSKLQNGTQTPTKFLESLGGVSTAAPASLNDLYSLMYDQRIPTMTQIKKLRAAGKTDEAQKILDEFNANITTAVNKTRTASGLPAAGAAKLKGLIIPQTWKSTPSKSPLQNALKGASETIAPLKPIEDNSQLKNTIELPTTPKDKQAIKLNSLPSDSELKRQISARESNGSYTAVNDATHDYGKYQVNVKTLKTYSEKFLGESLTPEQFLKSPDKQEQFMDAEIQHLKDLGVKKYDTFLALHHLGFSDVSTTSVNAAKNSKEGQRYIHIKTA